MRAAQLCLFSLTLLTTLETGLHAQTPALPCHGAQQVRQVAELLFGRDIGHKVGVSESAWARFLARELTPRFPDGITVTDAKGQWRDSVDGTIVHEPSKHVEIVLSGADGDDSRLDAVVAAYKRDFHQQSVAVIVRQACVSF